MKNKFKIFAFSALSVFLLPSCEQSGLDATLINQTEKSIYGEVINFTDNKGNPLEKVTGKPQYKVLSGDKVTFTVKPSDYFNISSVTNNGESCKKVRENSDGTQVWSATIHAGKNYIVAKYSVDPDVDFVSKFKLNIDDKVFNAVMSASDVGDKEKIDFRKSGIERCLAPLRFKSGSTSAKETNKKKTAAGKTEDVFINYVDGDTTHVETSNLQYTVKIRYLSINTPESTSEIEEWGYSASTFSKYIYSGEQKYFDEIKDTFSAKDKAGLQSGVTSLILVSQGMTKNIKNVTPDDLNIGTTDNGLYAATTDDNQRNLAYVWYATVANPKRTDFRCLNLEMVYHGFSVGTGSMDDTSEEYYKIFDAANLSAKANKRHIYSDMEDPNYYYYNKPGHPVENLSLVQLYNSGTHTDADIKYYPDSPFCDKKTLYRIKGFVSRKVGTAFYMQNKKSYTREEVEAGKALGIYVFTYDESIIREGDEVEVVGVVSSYGGTYQMQGIKVNDIDPDHLRETEIISRNNVIEPVPLTGAEFNAFKLPSVLVTITDNVWFYPFTSVYEGEEEEIGEGGSEEKNKYNDVYPFYNTSNSPIFYGSYGQEDNAQSVNDNHKAGKGSDSTRYTNEVIRFTVDQNIIVDYGDKCYSYRFFGGGEYWYNPAGAEYASAEYAPENAPVDPETGETVDPKNIYRAVKRTFDRKMSTGITVISHGYESTGGNKKMTATICSGVVDELNLKNVD